MDQQLSNDRVLYGCDFSQTKEPLRNKLCCLLQSSNWKVYTLFIIVGIRMVSIYSNDLAQLVCVCL